MLRFPGSRRRTERRGRVLQPGGAHPEVPRPVAVDPVAEGGPGGVAALVLDLVVFGRRYFHIISQS